jgi:hypothetical protein
VVDDANHERLAHAQPAAIVEGYGVQSQWRASRVRFQEFDMADRAAVARARPKNDLGHGVELDGAGHELIKSNVVDDYGFHLGFGTVSMYVGAVSRDGAGSPMTAGFEIMSRRRPQNFSFEKTSCASTQKK